jgi:hypothetical protein
MAIAETDPSGAYVSGGVDRCSDLSSQMIVHDPSSVVDTVRIALKSR